MRAWFAVTPDEFFGIVQIALLILAFFALILAFVYLAYERST